MHSLRRAILLLLAVSLAACAPAAAGSGSGARPSSRGPITADEALDTGAANAYEVVQARRPNWLHRRGAHTAGGGTDDIVVYLNDARLGGLESLRQVAAANVGEIRFYDAAAANYRFGRGHLNGAIQVVTEGSVGTVRP